MKDGYGLIQNKKQKLKHKFRKNSTLILKLLAENERLNMEIYGLIDSMDSLHRERQRLGSEKHD